tara:strand:+ start:138 stop:368 length:231 start_codon:yes stop_codon:yes gene_type:complete
MNKGDLVELCPMTSAYLIDMPEGEGPHYGILVSGEMWTMDSVTHTNESIWNVLVMGKIHEIFETDLVKVKIEQFKK